MPGYVDTVYSRIKKILQELRVFKTYSVGCDSDLAESLESISLQFFKPFDKLEDLRVKSGLASEDYDLWLVVDVVCQLSDIVQRFFDRQILLSVGS